MKRLFLLRHAKASRQDAPSDHARPLAPRGIWAAEAMARECAPRLVRIDVALCSSAIRTRETVRLFAHSLPPSCKIELDDALYLADSRELLTKLQGIADSRDAVLLVGHEPGLSDLARALCGDAGKKQARRRIAKGLKTSSLAILDLDVSHWAELHPGVGFLSSVIRPKDLP